MRGGNRVKAHESQSNALRSAKQLLGVARKVAHHRTDSYRLMGAYYWMINKPERALGWWNRAVQEGERLGARPQLARLYFEVGKCLLESKGKHAKLNGLRGEEYLEEARTLFEEMVRPSGRSEGL